ncbi:autotransporter outer membrane beta-barrel domain-containing protein [Pusillimonas caeni]|uniref:autotransporter outer membrane beta-barrel domain-containing protein n=1 Tax=Pusillimonas caeni TaxID=1348472 RepID=UPI001431FB69|nr:autotransporter outer membrane beta-barrel domain-containing protein [Pusillimonas caeni]
MQSHQSNTSLPGSHITINNSTVTTESDAYAVGVLAQKGTSISGTAVDVETSGQYGSGVEVDRGGQISLQGAEGLSTIVTNGAGAAGARAISGNEDGASKGSIILDRYQVESKQGVGLMAGDEDGAGGKKTAGDITFTNGEVLASGAGSSVTHAGAAARVMHGSKLVVKGSELVSEQHHGVVVDGSTAEFTDTDIVSNATGASGSPVAGLRASNSADVTVENGSINATAEGAAYTRGILAMSDATVRTHNTDIGTQGDHSHAVHAWGDSDLSTKPKVNLTGGQVTTQGFESYGLSAQNSGEIATENVDITTEGTWGFGAFAYKEGVLDIKGGSITTNGEGVQGNVINGYPVDVGNYGVLAKNKSSVTITGTTVTTKGQYAEGLRAENDGAAGNELNTASTIVANNVTVQTSGEEAHGVTAYGSNYDYEAEEWGSGSKLNFTGGSIKTSGEDAMGAVALNGGLIGLANTTITTSGEGADGVIAAVLVPEPVEYKVTTMAAGPVGYASSGVELHNVHINVSGKDAVGLGAYNGDSDIFMKGGSITASGEGSAGLQLLNGADIELDGVTVQANGPSIRSYFGTVDGSGILAEPEQTVELRGSNFTLNNSQFLHVTRGVGGENGEIAVNLRDGTVAIGNIENYGSDGKLGSSEHTHIEVDSTSSWVGVMMDDKTNVAKSGDTVTGSQAGNVTAPDGSNVSFQNVSSIGGSVSTTLGSNFLFAGSPTTIVGGLFGMPQSNVTFNNDVHIQGQGTGQQGGFAVNGVGSTFVFNGNTTIDGPVQGSGSSFAFSRSGTTNIGSLSLDNNSYTGLHAHIADLIAQIQARKAEIEQQIQDQLAKARAQLLALAPESRTQLASIGGGSIEKPINVRGGVDVTGGTTLGGNLNIQGPLNSILSFVAPGNSIGTITADSLGSVAGSVFEFEVDGNGQADLLVVRNGDADLKGAALKVDQYQGYRLDHDYTIIRTEAGNVVNEFDSEQLGDTFAGTLVKLDPVKYGAQDVKVSLSVDQEAIDRTGYSANQNATLDGALSVAGKNASADAVMLMQPDARKDALNQLSGELHGSTQAALLQSSSLVSRTLTQRLRANLGAGMLPGAPTAQAGGAVAGAMPRSAAYPLWAQVVGNWNTLDSDGNAAKVKTNTAGLFLGGDTEVGAGWRVGGALGYTDGRIKVDERDSKSDVSTFTAALYGGNSWRQGTGTLNFLAGAAYSHHDIDSRRTVNVGGSQTLKADYRAHTTQLFTELGYAVPVGERSVVEPYLGLAWLSQKAKGFTEEGGAAALQGESQKDDVTTFTLGLRGKTALNVGANPAHVFAGLGWRHASGDVDPGRRVSFVQGGGAAFNVAGAPIAKNAAVLDLGVEMSVGRNTAMGLGYSGQYGNDNTDHSGQLYLRTRF